MVNIVKNLIYIWPFIQSDYARYGRAPILRNILRDVILKWNHSFSYCFWLRLASKKNIFSMIAKYKHRKMSQKYGIQIYPSTKIGYGLCLGHGINIIVNPTTIIGNNCNLCHFTTIGSNHGKAANIGDNVYIGPNVTIIEDVNIKSRATIGAGSVVIDDVPEDTTVAGNPAKIVSRKSPGRYVHNKYEEYILLPCNAPKYLNEIQPSYIDKFIY